MHLSPIFIFVLCYIPSEFYVISEIKGGKSRTHLSCVGKMFTKQNSRGIGIVPNKLRNG